MEYIRVLAKNVLYLFQDGCRSQEPYSVSHGFLMPSSLVVSSLAFPAGRGEVPVSPRSLPGGHRQPARLEAAASRNRTARFPELPKVLN